MKIKRRKSKTYKRNWKLLISLRRSNRRPTKKGIRLRTLPLRGSSRKTRALRDLRRNHLKRTIPARLAGWKITIKKPPETNT